jgi:DNA-directed RNA polymerase subunit K/omega
MPPKKAKKTAAVTPQKKQVRLKTAKPDAQPDTKSDAKSDANPHDTDDDLDLNDDHQSPDMSVISDFTKERYEYTPILRNEIVYRLPEDRITSEVMTKFELCEVISIRARQLELGQKIFTDASNLTDPLDIAKKEISDKKCPLCIVRMITDKVAEKWQVNEMAIPPDVL